MKLGVIGYGSRIKDVLEEMTKLNPDCQVAAIVDLNRNEESQSKEATGSSKVQYFHTPEEMVAMAKVDGILIGTRCSLHTEMALKVLPSRIPLYLEKPVATSMIDLRRLKHGYETSRTEVVVSFPLRLTSIIKMVQEIVDSGKIGTIEHVQAVNNVPYGSVYYQSWYRDDKETGGLFLQKATHDFDYINAVLKQTPVSVCAMTSKQIFKGDKPAELKCCDCAEKKSCLESTAFAEPEIRDKLPYCCFAVDTGNEDSGSALIRYESGMHVSYSQNFFARRKAGIRGARFLGYKGTVEFDFFTNTIQVFMHHTPRVETYVIDPGKAHFGGDAALAENFINIIQGRASSISPLEDGLMSALTCIKAKLSAETGTFQRIEYS